MKDRCLFDHTWIYVVFWIRSFSTNDDPHFLQKLPNKMMLSKTKDLGGNNILHWLMIAYGY